MSRIKRVISTSFWEDETVVNDFSPEDKYFYLYLLTNPHTTQLGIYKLVSKTAAFELGYSIDSVSVLLERFENKYHMIKFSPKTSEVAIKKYLKHSILKGGKPVWDCLIKEEKAVKDRSLLIYVYEGLSEEEGLIDTVLSYVEHLYQEYINKKDNDNDNDNERNVDVALTLRKRNTFIPPSVDEVREYCLQNDKLYVNPESFVSFYASKDWYVGKNKMKDWHQAVAGWNTRSIGRGEKQQLLQPVWKKQEQKHELPTEMSDEEWLRMMEQTYGNA